MTQTLELKEFYRTGFTLKDKKSQFCAFAHFYQGKDVPCSPSACDRIQTETHDLLRRSTFTGQKTFANEVQPRMLNCKTSLSAEPNK